MCLVMLGMINHMGLALKTDKEERKLHFQPLSLHFFDRRDKYRGQENKSVRKLCLQGWAQVLQIQLYCRLPLLPRKKLQSQRHCLLRLMVHSVPVSLARYVFLQEASAGHIPFSPLPAVPGWRACSGDRHGGHY